MSVAPITTPSGTVAATGVFVLTTPGTLVAMQAARFATEDDFQDLIARFPALLAGDQIDATAPRRFLLVAREQGIADAEGAGARWSLDHLFLDQDGVPTLVEVKRATDTRLRREVVGQMLDYAANGVLYWPAAEIRARVEARCRQEGAEVTQVLEALAGAPVDPNTYWGRVAEHLTAGRVRLLFVADRVPPELRRVVEFLNAQMRPAEVLAVELRQYEGEGLRTLVPIVLGQSQAAGRAKGGAAPAGERWNEAGFLTALEAGAGPAASGATRRVMAWARERGLGAVYGAGQVASWSPVVRAGGTKLYPISLGSDGRLTVNFQYLVGKPVLGDEAGRRALMDRLNGLDYGLPEAGLARRPSVGPEIWADSERVEGLLAVLDGLLEEVRTSDELQAGAFVGSAS